MIVIKDLKIEIQCPSCHKKYAAPADKAGQMTKCPNCDSPITVPAIPTEPPPLPADRGIIDYFPVVPSDRIPTSSQPRPAAKKPRSHSQSRQAIIIICLICLGSVALLFTGGALWTVFPDDTKQENTIDTSETFDNLFVKNLDLSGGKKNLTEAYNQKYSKEEQTLDTLHEFVAAQPIITQLPEPLLKNSRILKTDTPLVFAAYMNIADTLPPFDHSYVINESMNRLYNKNDPGGIYGLASMIRARQSVLIETHVPHSAANLHKLLLSYTRLLNATYMLMGEYTDDPVKGRVGARQLDEIHRKYYPVIEREILRLQSLQREKWPT